MDTALALTRINESWPDGSWELEAALDGGSTGETFEVRSGTRRAVLKSTRPASSAVLEQMALVMGEAITLGWPAARWLCWAATASHGYVLLEWRDGRAATSLTSLQAETLITANGLQTDLAKNRHLLFDWSPWFEAITASNSVLLSRCETFSDGTKRLAARFRQVLGAANDRLRGDDLVHGDFATDNVLIDGPTMSIIDTQLLGRGSRVIDLATMGVHCIAWDQGADTADRFLRAAVEAGGWEQAMRCAAGRALIAVNHALDHYSAHADRLADLLVDLPDRVPR